MYWINIHYENLLTFCYMCGLVGDVLPKKKKGLVGDDKDESLSSHHSLTGIDVDCPISKIASEIR